MIEKIWSTFCLGTSIHFHHTISGSLQKAVYPSQPSDTPEVTLGRRPLPGWANGGLARQATRRREPTILGGVLQSRSEGGHCRSHDGQSLVDGYVVQANSTAQGLCDADSDEVTPARDGAIPCTCGFRDSSLGPTVERRHFVHPATSSMM